MSNITVVDILKKLENGEYKTPTVRKNHDGRIDSIKDYDDNELLLDIRDVWRYDYEDYSLTFSSNERNNEIKLLKLTQYVLSYGTIHDLVKTIQGLNSSWYASLKAAQREISED